MKHLLLAAGLLLAGLTAYGQAPAASALPDKKAGVFYELATDARVFPV